MANSYCFLSTMCSVLLVVLVTSGAGVDAYFAPGGLRADAGGVNEDAAPTAVRSETHEQAIETLRQAAQYRKAPAIDVSEALRGLAEETGLPDIMDAEDVEGNWELVFSTSQSSGYLPIRELVGFYPSREEASTDSRLGPLPMGGMRGHCLWKGGVENELAFTTEIVMLGPFKMDHDKNEVKTYKFFFHDGQILTARSNEGGFSLFSRVPTKDTK